MLWSSSSHVLASNLVMMRLRAPREKEGRKKAPLAWMIGAACRNVSPGPMSGIRSMRKFATSACSPRIVSVTAFGMPVVPPV